MYYSLVSFAFGFEFNMNRDDEDRGLRGEEKE